jgi:transcriptional regulator with XRE-family HTH domain
MTAAKKVSGDTRWPQVARQLKGWAETLLVTAGQAADLGLAVTQSRVTDPRKKAAIASAGKQLRQWRESAGLTLAEVGTAIDLKDPSLIEQAENGKIALPFEIILRLAGVLGRRDPLPLVMALTRQYNPKLWQSLEGLGVGRLVVQGVRERELANLYRSNDDARKLTDAQFVQVLAFTKQAFDMAVAFSQTQQASPSHTAKTAPLERMPADKQAHKAAPKPRKTTSKK